MTDNSDADKGLPQDQQEEMTDLHLGPEWYLGPSLWSTDWTTETIVSQLKRGNINLNPRFQRRNAWDRKRMSLFIESLILGLPVPQLVLAEEKNKRGSFIVIDGKQRLLSLRQFSADPTNDIYPQLKLVGLEDRSELNGMTYAQLKDAPEWQSELNTFDNQTIRTVVIRGWNDEKYLYSVFLRINTGSVQLSPQELRQALHPGPFSDFIDDFSVESVPLRRALKLDHPDFRMRDIELVLRFFAYQYYAHEYDGELKDFLDRTTERLNSGWSTQENEIRSIGEQLDKALSATREIFGERNELRKWNGEQYERPINRAVFDIMAFFFAQEPIRTRAIKAKQRVKRAFEDLCVENREFLSSIEATTKSIEANRRRFSLWAEALSKIVGIKVSSPIPS